MSALAAALLIALVPQDEAPLKESWPKLVEAWKAVEAYKTPAEPGLLDDEFLKVAAKLHAAFEAAGLYAPEGEYLPQALKAFVKIRARGISQGNFGLRVAGIRRIRMAAPGGGAFESGGPAEADPMGALLGSLKKIQTLKQGGLDDEENVLDELVTARKALKGLGVTADETPPALRRRVLVLIRSLAQGEAYPESAVATEDQVKQFRAWVTELGHEAIENREKAMKELLRAGEASLPVLREALKQGDAEIASRCKQLLGVGHSPWKARADQAAQNGRLNEAIIAPPAPPFGEMPK